MTRVIASLWLLALLLVGAGASAATDENAKDAKKEEKAVGLDRRVAEKLLQANELLAKEQYDGALAIVDALAQRRSLGPAELAQIHRFRGYIFVNKGMTDRAAAEFEQSLAQNALDRSAEQAMTYSLAQIYTQLGKYDAALRLIDAWFAAEENPKPDAYYLKAMILVQQEQFEEAALPARLAVEKSPQPKESWLQLQVAIYGHLKDYPNVATALAELANLVPTKKIYWLQLAAVQNYLERDAEALATMQLAHRAELLGEDKEYRQLARLLYLQQEPFQCAQLIDEAITKGSVKADEDSYGLLANCYLAARESEEALAPLAKAAELSTDGETYLMLGQLRLQREEYGEALDALQKALPKAKAERRGAVQLLIGVAQLGVDRFDDAERSFRAAQSDEKVRKAAETYLKLVQEQRERHEQQKALETAQN